MMSSRDDSKLNLSKLCNWFGSVIIILLGSLGFSRVVGRLLLGILGLSRVLGRAWKTASWEPWTLPCGRVR